MPREVPQVANPIALSQPKAEPISVDQLELLLPKHPFRVGFDIDDTLIASSPAFDVLQPQYDRKVIHPKDFRALKPDEVIKYREFWNRLNDEYDDRSVPKPIGKRLLDLHIARGDDIYLITRRPASQNGDACTPRYEKMFGVKLAHPVVYTERQDKTPFIHARRLDYYYGDSDSDITAAVSAGAIPIRVIRSSESTNREPVHNGQLGEIVLKDSDR